MRKSKRVAILSCCALIACLGAILTGCGNGTGTFIGDGLSADIAWEPTEDGLTFTDFGGTASFVY